MADGTVQCSSTNNFKQGLGIDMHPERPADVHVHFTTAYISLTPPYPSECALDRFTLSKYCTV